MQDWRKFSREIDRPRIGASDSSIFLKPSLATLPFVRYPREQLYTRARMYCEPFRENNTIRGEASFITGQISSRRARYLSFPIVFLCSVTPKDATRCDKEFNPVFAKAAKYFLAGADRSFAKAFEFLGVRKI